jgi:hypothetical protein
MAGAWSDFFVTIGGAAAALTGLLFVAVALRPREIRASPLMVGRARSAFYAFATVVLASLLALMGTNSRLVGVGELLVALGALAASYPFTLNAIRNRSLNYRRALVYHGGLAVVAAGGLVRAVGGGHQATESLLAVGSLLLVGVALSNAWQLVLSHESGEPDPP